MKKRKIWMASALICSCLILLVGIAALCNMKSDSTKKKQDVELAEEKHSFDANAQLEKESDLNQNGGTQYKNSQTSWEDDGKDMSEVETNQGSHMTLGGSDGQQNNQNEQNSQNENSGQNEQNGSTIQDTMPNMESGWGSIR